MIKFFSLLLLLMFMATSHAAILTSVGKGKGIISLGENESVEVGKTYYLLDLSGKAIGKVKIKKIKKDSAIVLISKSAKGKAKVGFKVDVDDLSQISLEEENLDSPSKSKSKIRSEHFRHGASLYSEGMMTGFLGAKFRSEVSGESFYTLQVTRVGLKNEADNVQEGWQALVGFGLPLSGQNFSSGFNLEGHVGYINTNIAFTDQFSSEFEANLSGTVIGGHCAYHFALDQYFFDLGATINYYMLDDAVPVRSGHVEEVPLSGLSFLLHLGIGLHF